MKKILIALSLLLMVFVSSCIPHKDTLYIQDKGSQIDSLQTIVEQQKPYRVQINDILNIRIKALDQDNVQIFNPIGNADLNASSVERSYFDGFT